MHPKVFQKSSHSKNCGKVAQMAADQRIYVIYISQLDPLKCIFNFGANFLRAFKWNGGKLFLSSAEKKEGQQPREDPRRSQSLSTICLVCLHIKLAPKGTA